MPRLSCERKDLPKPIIRFESNWKRKRSLFFRFLALNLVAATVPVDFATLCLGGFLVWLAAAGFRQYDEHEKSEKRGNRRLLEPAAKHVSPLVSLVVVNSVRIRFDYRIDGVNISLLRTRAPRDMIDSLIRRVSTIGQFHETIEVRAPGGL